MRRHNKGRYRSGLEKEVAAYLRQNQKKVRYEVLKVEWEDLRYRKHREIQRQHPELDIRFVFSNANAKLYKGAKSRYCNWCEQHKFQWAHRVIPEEWLKEKGKEITVKKIELKTKRKN